MFQKEKEEGSKRKNIEITNIEKKKELKVEKRFCSIFFFFLGILEKSSYLCPWLLASQNSITGL